MINIREPSGKPIFSAYKEDKKDKKGEVKELIYYMVILSQVPTRIRLTVQMQKLKKKIEAQEESPQKKNRRDEDEILKNNLAYQIANKQERAYEIDKKNAKKLK